MVIEQVGDIVSVDADIVAHQTNYCGIMGAGVAWAIGSQLLPAAEYRKYTSICMVYGKQLLGSMQMLNQKIPGRYVANIFSQDEDKLECATDYNALRMGLCSLEREARRKGLTVALPAKMGCGIAGGDWCTVRGIIGSVFDASPVTCIIVSRGKDAEADPQDTG